MSIAKLADHSQSRAIIIAALIGLLGTVIGTVTAALLGARAGEDSARDEIRNLENKLDKQGKDIQTLQERIVEREKNIQTLTAQIEQGLSPQRPTSQVSQDQQAHDAFKPEPTSGTTGSQPPVIRVKRLSPFDISLIKCEHWGSGLACDFIFKNTGSAAAHIAIDTKESFAYDESGNEYKLEEATLGSRRWSARQFGAIGLEPSIPVAARFRFGIVPQGARRGHLRFVLAVLPAVDTMRLWGMQVDWSSMVLDDVPFT